MPDPKILIVNNRGGISYQPSLYIEGILPDINEATAVLTSYYSRKFGNYYALGWGRGSAELPVLADRCDRIKEIYSYSASAYISYPYNDISPELDIYSIGSAHPNSEGWVDTEIFAAPAGTGDYEIGLILESLFQPAGIGEANRDRVRYRWRLFYRLLPDLTIHKYGASNYMLAYAASYNKIKINIAYDPTTTDISIWITQMLNESSSSFNLAYTTEPSGAFYDHVGHGGLLYSDPPSPRQKGEFKGMPTSNIPMRQFIRSGVDYRHKIDLYDETNYSPKNMFLTNFMGTIDYSQVEYGNPDGTIKVKTDINFTHFVYSSFSDENRPLIYKVDHYETVGAGVIRCRYSIDFIKSFFQYHGITDNNPICMRSTSAVGYEPYIMDHAVLNGDYDVNRIILSSNEVTSLYVIKTIDNIYATTAYGFGLFKSWLSSNINNKIIINQIEKIFIIPYGTFAGHTLATTSSFDFYKESGGSYTTISFAPAELSGDIFTISPSNTIGSYISVNIDSSFSDRAMDFIGANSYVTLHAPYYGDISLNASEIIGMSAYSTSPKFHYYIDFEGGNIAIQYHDGDYDGLFHSYVQAPSPSLSTIDLESIRFLEASQNIGYTRSITNTITGIGAGAATGAVAGALTGIGPGAILGAGVNALTGLISSSAGLADMARTNSNEMQHLLNTLSTDIVQASGTASAAVKYFYAIMVTPKLSESLSDYYEVVGYPIRKAWNTIGAVEGECYWLNWNFSLIKDTEEVVNGFALASSEGIIYNY